MLWGGGEDIASIVADVNRWSAPMQKLNDLSRSPSPLDPDGTLIAVIELSRLINSPRRTKIGHVEAFPVLHMRSLRKSAMFSEGQRTEGHFRYPGASNAITIISICARSTTSKSS
jgi:hypothetical protein